MNPQVREVRKTIVILTKSSFSVRNPIHCHCQENIFFPGWDMIRVSECCSMDFKTNMAKKILIFIVGGTRGIFLSIFPSVIYITFSVFPSIIHIFWSVFSRVIQIFLSVFPRIIQIFLSVFPRVIQIVLLVFPRVSSYFCQFSLGNYIFCCHIYFCQYSPRLSGTCQKSQLREDKTPGSLQSDLE